MLKNYIIIAWRNLKSHRFFSAVNIVGLAIGILFTLLIGAYVWNETQVNKQLRNADRQYFLMSEWKDPNQGAYLTTTAPLAKQLKEEYPTLVANYYRWDGITSVVSKGEKHLREGIQIGDSTLLKMYGFELLHGNAATALNEPFSVVITEEAAIKYFSKTDAVGETIDIQSFSGTNHPFKVTGVMRDPGENSVTSINAQNFNDFFIPLSAVNYFGRSGFDLWTNIWAPSYIELQKGVKPADLDKPILDLLNRNTPDFIKSNLKVKPVLLTEFYMQKDGAVVQRMLYTLSFVAGFILLMAIINFINISISSSSSRTREIGLRKVLGGLKKQLMMQFFIESIILVCFATIVALALYPLSTPYFTQLIGKQIPKLTDFPLYFVSIPFVLILAVGILAGTYPSSVLASLKSVDSLKGKLKTVRENVWLRKSLLGFQFGIAIIVLIVAIIVTQQINYFFSRQLGYNKEYIVSSQVPRDWSPAGVRKMETVRNEFAKMPMIRDATLSYEIPNGMNGGQPSIYKYGSDSTSAIAMQAMVTDGHYADAYQIPMKAGDFLSKGGAIDSLKIVLNENAAKALGWNSAENAVGKQLKVAGDPRTYQVQGVTSDFHFNSMQQKIQPCVIFNVRVANAYRFLSFKIEPGNIGSTISAIEKKWSMLMPGSSFEYRFMDDSLKQLYTSEIQLKRAGYTAGLLCMIIVFLGVLGLISLSVHKRTKEIGIRKVLGSSVKDILLLFMKEFIGIVTIAAVVACPIAYWISNEWLNGYAYRISMTSIPFVLSIGIVMILTIVLIAGQTFKAAVANPVKSLRTE
jgi:ABC-type antimicrobial peptide transport system permease subunit